MREEASQYTHVSAILNLAFHFFWEGRMRTELDLGVEVVEGS